MVRKKNGEIELEKVNTKGNQKLKKLIKDIIKALKPKLVYVHPEVEELINTKLIDVVLYGECTLRDGEVEFLYLKRR